MTDIIEGEFTSPDGATTAIATQSATSLTASAANYMPVFAIEQVLARRNQLVGFVKAIMIESQDFGKIPGTDKNVLLKPGAEKLITFFGLTPSFVLREAIEDWTGADHGGESLFYYRYSCALSRNGVVIGEGEGSCNTWESKYRWRKQERACPACGANAIFASKHEPGWYCWNKKGGCGKKFPQNDAAITSQSVGRIPNPDIADLINTVQKMAQKRAMIAAVLISVNASEYFTQDVEDMPSEGGEREEYAQAAPPDSRPAPPANGGNRSYPPRNSSAPPSRPDNRPAAAPAPHAATPPGQDQRAALRTAALALVELAEREGFGDNLRRPDGEISGPGVQVLARQVLDLPAYTPCSIQTYRDALEKFPDYLRGRPEEVVEAEVITPDADLRDPLDPDDYVDPFADPPSGQGWK